MKSLDELADDIADRILMRVFTRLQERLDGVQRRLDVPPLDGVAKRRSLPPKPEAPSSTPAKRRTKSRLETRGESRDPQARARMESREVTIVNVLRSAGADGMSIGALAERVGCGKATMQYTLAKLRRENRVTMTGVKNGARYRKA